MHALQQHHHRQYESCEAVQQPSCSSPGACLPRCYAFATANTPFQCQYCLDLVCGPKSKHEQHCIANPVAVAGTIPKKTKTANRDCRFCSTAVDNTDEHEDICAPSHISRYMCPCTEDGVDCLYFSIDAHRAQHHARRSNRRKVDENDPFKCPLRDPLLKPMPEDIDEIIVQRL
jgi:hypothetical protein